jgi:hypothetical protein
VPKRAQKMKNKSVPKKSDFLEESDLSNRAQTCPKNEKQIRAQEIRFFGKLGFLLKKQNL